MASGNYKKSLETCAAVASQEHKVATASLSHAKGELSNLADEIRKVVDLVGYAGPATDDAREKLGRLGKRVTKMASQELNDIQASLNRKKKRLSKFTVTLFGRTMAGKSTIREAITLGDGSTIGMGGQRTTRDIREYVWNHLRILDTPGIGAYQGSEDKKMALSVVDESDLILFLVSSDSIQRESFDGMKALRNQNKAIVFVLNVKRDLTKSVYLRQFLRNPEKVFAEDQLKGHFRRIRRLAGDELGMRHIKIVPIHALAAFLATRPEHVETSQLLGANSRIQELVKALEREVRTNGPVRRLQTLLDATSSYLMDLCEGLRSEAEEIRKSAYYLKGKFDGLNDDLTAFVKRTRARIERETCEKLDKLKRQVSSFVDENIEKRDVDKRWKSLVQQQDIEIWSKDVQKSVIDELMGKLSDFNKEIERETELLKELRVEGPQCYDPHDIKRSLKWISAGSSALVSVAAVAIWIGGSNVWNPIGWIAGIVAVVSLFLSWIFSDRESKIREHKKKACEDLRGRVDQIQLDVSGKLLEWFEQNICTRVIEALKKETGSFYQGMIGLAEAIEGSTRKIFAKVEASNRRLVARTGQLRGIKVSESGISRIARDPGLAAKIMPVNTEMNRKQCRVIGKALGERLDLIEIGSAQDMVVQALLPAVIKPSMVELDQDRVKVYASAAQIDKAIGKNGHNVRLASQLLQIKIEILKEA